MAAPAHLSRPRSVRVGFQRYVPAYPAASIIIPTYNEAENLRKLIPRIRACQPGCEIIVVDDASPDGTADVAERLGARVLRRGRKLGRASAVMDGVQFSTGRVVGVIDADLSHPPEIIPALVGAAIEGKIGVASRYVEGGGGMDASLPRRLISKSAGWIARSFLHVKAHDCASGFFFAPRKAFDNMRMRSQGLTFLLNVLVDNRETGIVEVPYEFGERAHGVSKFGLGEIPRYVKTVWALRH